MKLKTKFTKLTADQKRVAIAKDVLKQIKAEKLVPIHFGYIRMGAGNGIIDRSVLQGQNVVCEACAAGSAILSGIRLFNQHTVSNNPWDTELRGKWFTDNQLAAIEAAYEQSENCSLSEHATKDLSPAIRFGKKHEHSIDRIRAIFRNIIKNNGTFKP